MATFFKILVLGFMAWLYLSYIHTLGMAANTQLDQLKKFYDPAQISQIASGGETVTNAK